MEKVAGDGAVLRDVDIERSDLIEELGMATKFHTTRWKAVTLREAVMKLVAEPIRAAFQTERAKVLAA